MSSSKLLLASVLLFAACAPFKYYPLPVPSSEARDTFAPIATAASEKGYKFWRWDDSVSFEPDSKLRVSYMFDASGNYVMCVMVKDKNIEGGVDAAFVAGKAKGDDIWQRAMALRPVQPVVIVPAPVVVQPGVQVNIGR